MFQSGTSSLLHEREATKRAVKNRAPSAPAHRKRRVTSEDLASPEHIERFILILRGQKVILDRDLATVYVMTLNLNKAVTRNIERFPPDFMFQLAKDEAANLMLQSGTSSWGGTRKLPRAFTEGRGDALKRPQQPPRSTGQYRDHAGVRAPPTDTANKHGPRPKTCGAGKEIPRPVSGRLRRDSSAHGPVALPRSTYRVSHQGVVAGRSTIIGARPSPLTCPRP